MSTKLYVSNISWEVTNDELKEYFSSVGSVLSAFVVFDRETKKSKGFGFVEMSTREEAREAIKKLDGKYFRNRTLVVREAKPDSKQDYFRKVVAFVNKSVPGQKLELKIKEKRFIISRVDFGDVPYR